MPGRPRIGVSAFLHHVDGRFHAEVTGIRNTEAVSEVAGGAPLILAGRPEAFETDELVDLLDGLVLTGARPNVHPSHYGHAETERHGAFDPGRDAVMLPLLVAMIEAGKPVLGLCRGIQEMAVAYGATLHPEIRDEPGRMNHRMPPGETDETVIFEKRHRVTFREGGAFHRLLGLTETMTNTLHGQAVWEPGARVRVEGWAEDGTIEAISIPEARGFALGVQWHAEHDAANDPVSRAIFEAFGAAARAARDARAGAAPPAARTAAGGAD